MDKDEEIKWIAYSIWEEEGYQHGMDMEHWFKAEVIWNNQHKPKQKITATKNKTTKKSTNVSRISRRPKK